MTCTHTWCDSTMPNHFEHSGILATVSAGGNDVDVMIYIDSEGPTDSVVYTFEWHWGIDTGTAEHEFAVLRSLLDQIEAVVTEAEKIYPRKTGAEVTS